MIPVPFDHTPFYPEYVKMMGEQCLTLGSGANLRVTLDSYGKKWVKTMYFPIVEDRSLEFKEAINICRNNGVSIFDFVEHPFNTCDGEEIHDIYEQGNNLRYTDMATFLIDLKDEDWRPGKKVRQNCRNFDKAGCYIQLISDKDDFEKYHKLYLMHRQDLCLAPWPRGCFDAIWAWRNESTFTLGAYNSDNELISAMSFLCGKDWIEEVHVARVTELPSKVYPIEPIRMGALDIARERRISYYDLGGVTPSPEPNSKDEGIKRSKSKYNGIYKQYKRYVLWL